MTDKNDAGQVRFAKNSNAIAEERESKKGCVIRSDGRV